MYETEANFKAESSSQIPAEVLSAFGDSKDAILSRTLISWGEHCTECGWPTCYSTCDLYSPREDLRCRRFVDGMVRVDCAESANKYLLKISFKRWGMLWARGNFRLHSVDQAARLEQRDYRIGNALQQLPVPTELKRKVIAKRYAIKKRLASRGTSLSQRPTSFVLECYNPNAQTIKLSLRIRSLHSNHPFPNLVQLMPGFRQARELAESRMPFETLIAVQPGFQRTIIDFAQMAPMIDLENPFRIDITPNEVEDGTTLIFGLMDFVQGTRVEKDAVKPVKCVIWDLDNTMWNGILAEDGSGALSLKPGIVDVIKELDRRGILQSVASKNSREEALDVLKRFHLDSYFLHPQISWQPKSEGIKAIAAALNIGMDSLLFVDDSEFELHEVQDACKGVRCMAAELYLTLPEKDECRVPITLESSSRRKMYQVEEVRHAVAEEFGQDYLAFLRHCQIKLTIGTLSNENLERVHELTQRTNQLNFSGNRYDREVLKAIQLTPHLDTYVLSCQDRFGVYGVVGFAIVDRREPRMTDLMFSCRIQSKRVEHAFLAYLIRKYAADLGRDFKATYRRTSRNAPAGQVFSDMGMNESVETSSESVWSFPKDRELVDENIVELIIAENSSSMTLAETATR